MSVSYNKTLRSSLLAALRTDKPDEVKKCIEGIPADEHLDEKGNALLSFLAETKHEDIASWYLVHYDVDSSLKNTDGQTALHIATINKLHGLVASLSSRLDAEEVDNLGRNALAYAVLEEDEILTRILSERMLSTDQCDVYGLSPVAYTLLLQNANLAKIITEDKFPTITVFNITSLPPDVPYFPLDVTFPYRTSILHLAVISSDPDLLHLAVKVENNFDFKDSSGKTPLEIAAELHLPDFCYTLSALGSKNPLFEAIIADNFEGFCEFMDSYGHTVDRVGKTPMHYAAEYGRTKMLSILVGRYPQLPDFLGNLPLAIASTDECRQIITNQTLPINFYGHRGIPGRLATEDLRFANLCEITLAHYKGIVNVFRWLQIGQLGVSSLSNVAASIVEAFPRFKRRLAAVRETRQLELCAEDVGAIYALPDFMAIVDGVSERAQAAKARPDEKDAVYPWLVMTNIIGWVRCVLGFLTSAVAAFGCRPIPLQNNLPHAAALQGVVDDVIFAITAKGRADLPTLAKTVMVVRATISGAEDAVDASADLLVRSHVLQLLHTAPTDRSVMLPPNAAALPEGAVTIVVCENKLVLHSPGKNSCSVPLFGAYLKPIGQNSAALVWHAGRMKLTFESAALAHKFWVLFEALTAKYSSPELFMTRETPRRIPMWFLFSFFTADREFPSLVLKAAIVETTKDITDVVDSFYNGLSCSDPSSWRVQLLPFNANSCSPSIIE